MELEGTGSQIVKIIEDLNVVMFVQQVVKDYTNKCRESVDDCKKTTAQNSFSTKLNDVEEEIVIPNSTVEKSREIHLTKCRLTMYTLSGDLSGGQVT